LVFKISTAMIVPEQPKYNHRTYVQQTHFGEGANNAAYRTELFANFLFSPATKVLRPSVILLLYGIDENDDAQFINATINTFCSHGIDVFVEEVENLSAESDRGSEDEQIHRKIVISRWNAVNGTVMLFDGKSYVACTVDAASMEIV
ncbi:MAG: hypothetical protein EZS28_045504, partial [Streblomastix strix]